MCRSLRWSLPFVLIAMGVAIPCAAQDAGIRGEGAWIRQPAPSRDVTAAYVVLVNDGDTPVSIVSGTSTAATTIELHEMAMKDGMMRMRRVQEIVVPPRGRITLAPGGLHLMLFGLTSPLQVGARVELVLGTADGKTIPVQADVRTADALR
ncbi:MAG: copper chaperone PCu(A)C [Acidobacteria bacterium]|nr:copper chaperone PCu(A)C [Acidobacteriota bacterium]